MAYLKCDGACHVGVAFTATYVASEILIFRKSNFLKYQVTAKLLYQVINKGFQVSKQVITYLNPALLSVSFIFHAFKFFSVKAKVSMYLFLKITL